MKRFLLLFLSGGALWAGPGMTLRDPSFAGAIQPAVAAGSALCGYTGAGLMVWYPFAEYQATGCGAQSP
jgi:hypothetical protein